MAEEISRDYVGKRLLLIGILKGVAFFMTDLMRQLDVPVSVDYMFISKYHVNGDEAGAVRILKDLDMSIQGEDVLLVEDIVDTGFTLRYILSYLRARKPASLQVCTLLDRRARRLVEVPIGYVAFEIPDKFVVGYGLDHRELYRNLPYICVPEAGSLPGMNQSSVLPGHIPCLTQQRVGVVDADRGVVRERALVLTDAAADAAGPHHSRPFDRHALSIFPHRLHLIQHHRFGRDRAHLLADDAVAAVGPRHSLLLVDVRRADDGLALHI